jgi:fatty acid desaturase 2 (delta-6 desaturase)
VIYRISELLGLLTFGLYLLLWSDNIALKTIGLFSFAMYQGRSGWLMHEGGHHSLTGVPNVDRFIQAVIYGMVK